MIPNRLAALGDGDAQLSETELASGWLGDDQLANDRLRDASMVRAFRRAAAVVPLLALAACAAVPAPVVRVSPSSRAVAEADLPPLQGVSAPAPPLQSRRRVGDVFVHHFQNSRQKRLLTLTEKVVAREGDVLVVDYELQEGDRLDRLRVRLSTRSERFVSVHRMDGEREVLAQPEEYEAVLARTSFVPDQNDGRIDARTETCLVGPREFDCQVAKFKVFVGDREASLTVKSSQQAGRDLSGEVVALDGTVLYRAELVEMQRGPDVVPASDASAKLGAIAR